MNDSKCKNRQLEIDFYHKLGLELPECIIATYTSPQQCELTNVCAKHLGDGTA